MTDRELLELAAKVADITWDEDLEVWLNAESYLWSPLVDDGDALRLAASLCMTVDIGRLKSMATNASLHKAAAPGYAFAQQVWCNAEVEDGDVAAATRRSIVRAAAEIGKTR